MTPDLGSTPLEWEGKLSRFQGQRVTARAVSVKYAYVTGLAVSSNAGILVEKELDGLEEYLIKLSCCSTLMDATGGCNACGDPDPRQVTETHWMKEGQFREEAERLMGLVTDPLTAFLWAEEVTSFLSTLAQA